VRWCGTRPAAAQARREDVLTPRIRAAADTERSLRLAVSEAIAPSDGGISGRLIGIVAHFPGVARVQPPSGENG